MTFVVNAVPILTTSLNGVVTFFALSQISVWDERIGWIVLKFEDLKKEKKNLIENDDCCHGTEHSTATGNFVIDTGSWQLLWVIFKIGSTTVETKGRRFYWMPSKLPFSRPSWRYYKVTYGRYKYFANSGRWLKCRNFSFFTGSRRRLFWLQQE